MTKVEQVTELYAAGKVEEAVRLACKLTPLQAYVVLNVGGVLGEVEAANSKQNPTVANVLKRKILTSFNYTCGHVYTYKARELWALRCLFKKYTAPSGFVDYSDNPFLTEDDVDAINCFYGHLSHTNFDFNKVLDSMLKLMVDWKLPKRKEGIDHPVNDYIGHFLDTNCQNIIYHRNWKTTERDCFGVMAGIFHTPIGRIFI